MIPFIFSPPQNLFSPAQELERKAKETKNMDEWKAKCGSAVWKDRSGDVVSHESQPKLLSNFQ